MAPALTKILKAGHGIHLSSPPASVRMDSKGRPICSPELEPLMRPTEDGDPQKMWLNLSLFPSLDSSLPTSPLDLPGNTVLSPCFQVSASQCETVLLPSPASLLSLQSCNKSLRDSHQVVSVFPSVPDMFLGLVPGYNSQEAYLLHGCGAAPECGDMHHSPLTRTSVFPLYSLGEEKSQGCTPFFASPPTVTQEKVAGMGCVSSASVQCSSYRVNFDPLASRGVLEEAMKEQLSRTEGLHNRAGRLQRRLHALLGEHALRHCNQQLKGLQRHCQLGDVSYDNLDSINPGVLPSQLDSKPHFSQLGSSTVSYLQLRELSRSSQAVLRGLQEALDSEATASSSSDDELEEDKTKILPVVYKSTCQQACRMPATLPLCFRSSSV
uniref:KAT8 regulatory NSL complex subunit 1-like protein n=1 Tax=Monopterus albus TaxID=43700 RepID=UPI0009B3878B|nr:KAT8 regulatory NSL complex subunit 1-like protein [Monopterus albus]XP_020463316.1 KAT8 regulatory NSL complex subunit 1-like protein [Monopterus albus]